MSRYNRPGGGLCRDIIGRAADYFEIIGRAADYFEIIGRGGGLFRDNPVIFYFPFAACLLAGWLAGWLAGLFGSRLESKLSGDNLLCRYNCDYLTTIMNYVEIIMNYVEIIGMEK